MKRFDILRTLTFLILAYGIFSGSSCFKSATDNIDSKDGCGDKVEWTKSFKWDEYTATDLRDSDRSFYYTPTNTPKDICINKHTNVKYTVMRSYNPPVSGTPIFYLYGLAQWGGSYERKSSLFYSLDGVVSTYHESEEIGLAQLKSPAEIGFVVLITFKTKGTLNNDIKFIDSCISSVHIAYDYYKVE